MKDSPDDGVSVNVGVIEDCVEIRQQSVAQHHSFAHHLLCLLVKTTRVLQSQSQSQFMRKKTLFQRSCTEKYISDSAAAYMVEISCRAICRFLD